VEYPVIEKGEGVYLYDESGKQYLDATGGPMLINIGHGVPEIADALAEQARKVAYIHGPSSPLDASRSSRGVRRGPPGDIDRIYLLAGGSEANEAAFKLAVQYQDTPGPAKYRLVGRWMSFHGCTLGTLSMGRGRTSASSMSIVITSFPTQFPATVPLPLGKTYPQCT